MTLSVLTKLAVQGMAKRRTVYFPYFLALVLIMSLEYIMISLMSNEYVQTRHAQLPTIIIIGVFFTSLLAVIFILYANNFIQRQRRMEFALYMVLGLESRHIRGVIFIEQFLTWVIGSLLSIGVGYALGNVMFIALNRLIQDMGAGLGDYPFSPWAALGTTVIIAGIMLIIYLINSLRLARLNPAELLSQTHAGEAEPKSRWFILLIGLITLGAGYYIALTTTDVLDALLKVFVAIFLIIVATYALLMSLSIIFLKRMKHNKAYYYQSKHFLSVSGMLYRMKANATSLAGIAVLCTGIVLTLGTTLTLYLGMEEQTEKMNLREFELSYLAYSDGSSPENAPLALDDVMEDIQADYDTQDELYLRNLFFTSIYRNDDFTTYNPQDNEGFTPVPSDYAFLYAVPLDDFNTLHNENYTLSENEVLYATKSPTLIQDDTVSLAGESFTTKEVNPEYIPSSFIGNVALVVVPTVEDLVSLKDAFPNYNSEGERLEQLMNFSLMFNAVDEETRDRIQATLPEDDIMYRGDLGAVRVISSAESIQQLYIMNGGFLFLGMIVGMVLIIGTVLMLYFKQVSEGYQDQEKYQIMRKVGLPENIIKQTIQSQVFWIFALPIMIAVIHSLFASKIMFSLLSLLAVDNLNTFMIGYGSVLGFFVVIYLLFYFITSRVYYRIINQ